MYVRRSNIISANDSVLNINTDPVFITIKAFAILFGPPCVKILLVQEFWSFLPLFRDLAFLNIFVFFAYISLYWDWNYSCINNLAALDFKTLITQKLFKSREDFFYQTCFP